MSLSSPPRPLLIQGATRHESVSFACSHSAHIDSYRSVGVFVLIPTEQLRHRRASSECDEALRDLKRDAAGVIYNAVMRVRGASLEGMSRECGRSKNAARRWADSDHGSLPHLVDMALMDSAVALRLLRWVASAHGFGLHELPQDCASESNIVAMTALVRSSSALTPDVVEALADGRVDAREARELRPAIVEVFEAAASALASVDAILEGDQ